MFKDADIESTLKKARSLAGDLQPWPDYFESKAMEWRTILKFHGLGAPEHALEIGCGNGFTACLLAGRAARVAALDLPLPNGPSHSLGIRKAKDLAKRLGVRNVDIVGASCEHLPFTDKAFGLILSEYALQYVPDKNRALGEMRRVLKDDGIMVMVVPNFMERLCAPFMKYKYLLRRSLSRLARRAAPAPSGTGGSQMSGASTGRTESASGGIGRHLLLGPDGAYKSFGEEMARHTPASWKRLFENNGFRILSAFTTQVLPLGLLDVLGAPAARSLARKAHILNMGLGDKPMVKWLGYSICLVVSKGGKR